MVNQNSNSNFYSSSTTAKKVLNCSGTYLNPNDCFVNYFIKKETNKEKILNLFKNEVFFDKDDESAAEKEIEKLIVKKQDNFYNYYG